MTHTTSVHYGLVGDKVWGQHDRPKLSRILHANTLSLSLCLQIIFILAVDNRHIHWTNVYTNNSFYWHNSNVYKAGRTKCSQNLGIPRIGSSWSSDTWKPEKYVIQKWNNKTLKMEIVKTFVKHGNLSPPSKWKVSTSSKQRRINISPSAQAQAMLNKHPLLNQPLWNSAEPTSVCNLLCKHAHCTHSTCHWQNVQ